MKNSLPIPDAAKVMRLGSRWRLGPPSRLKVVGGAAPVQKLRAALDIRSRTASDWRLLSGEFAMRDEVVEIELGLKGELLLVLFGGSISVTTLDGDEVALLSAAAGELIARQIVFCRARHTESQLVLRVRPVGGPAKGIWCASGRSHIEPSERENDPESQDVFFTREFYPVDPAGSVNGVFCPGAVALIDTEDSYRHYESGLVRFSFETDGFSEHEGWSIADWSDETSVLGMQAGPVRRVSGEHRPLLIEHSGLEAFIALNGVVWVAVSPRKAPGWNEGKRHGQLSTVSEEGAEHEANFVTALVAPEDEGFDVMLVEPTFNHTVWMEPASDARFLHVCFADPLDIRPARVRRLPQVPVAKQRPKRAAASTKGNSETMTAVPPAFEGKVVPLFREDNSKPADLANVPPSDRAAAQ